MDDFIASSHEPPSQPQVRSDLDQQLAGSGGPSKTPDWQMNPEIEISDWTVVEKTESPGFVMLDSVHPDDSSAALVKFSCHMRDAFSRPYGFFAQAYYLTGRGSRAQFALQHKFQKLEQAIFHLQFRECALLQEHFAIIKLDLEKFVAQVRKLKFLLSRCKLWILMTDLNDRVAKNSMAADPMPLHPMKVLQENSEEDVSVMAAKIWDNKGTLVYVGRTKELA